MTTRVGRSPGRTAATLGLAALLVGSWADRAAADPPRPTNHRSEVVAVEPPLPEGVTVRVVGGDSFLELEVAPGHEVEVPDYGTDGGTYLRVGADGTVERDRRAVATAANERRYGTGEGADPDAPPDWEVVARDGRYAWHDHRIHWMARTEPQVVAPDGLIDLGGPEGRWEVALVVDGTPTTVQGELRRLDAPSPLPWLALGGVAALVGVALVRARRWRPVLGVATALGLAGVAASAATFAAAPDGSGASWWPLAVAGAAAAGGALGALGPHRTRLAAAAATAAGLAAWGVLRASVLWHAIVPTNAPGAFDRAVTAAAIGLGLALAVGVVWRPPTATAPASAPAR